MGRYGIAPGSSCSTTASTASRTSSANAATTTTTWPRSSTTCCPRRSVAGIGCAKVSTVAELETVLVDIESHKGAAYVEVMIPDEESQPLPDDVIDRGGYKLRTPR